MLSIIIPDYLDFIEAAENKFLHNKLIMFMIKKKTRRHFARNIEQSLLGFKTNYCEQKMVLKKENYEILLKVENILNENQLFESYSNILSIIINSCGIFCSLVNGRMYSWKNFLFIIKSLLLKSMRDKKENK